jgi:hypothetical protein
MEAKPKFLPVLVIVLNGVAGKIAWSQMPNTGRFLKIANFFYRFVTQGRIKNQLAHKETFLWAS